VLYLNSFFDPVFAVRPLVARLLGRLPKRPLILAPRGEFSPGALKLKRWKKGPYRWLASVSGICREITWQASSGYEAADIRCAIGAPAQRIVVAPDLPPLPASHAVSGAESGAHEGPLRAIFLSRITQKKNLDFALRVLARLRVPAQFKIYGPVRSDSYWQRCQELIASLPSHVTAQYHGPVEPAKVPAIMADNDLFFLPTLGENYGHVIAEAMAAGTPVLIADTTPWRGLEQLGVGWDLPLDSEQAFAEKIELCAGLDSGEWRQWRASVQVYARKRLTDARLTDANRRLFLDTVGVADLASA
jgi:glycosyltransferase involved in cell wall biosynthesis